ncbi:MAG TPA: hypothetical protein VLJ88_12825 [Propionibacteriaceae bacterium]|nr:hypothetical protein [Propionibacteriaceae bacterium]
MLADERRWRHRVPLTALRALLVFGVVALLAIEMVLASPPCSIAPGCRQPLGSPTTAVSAGLQFAVVLGVVVLPIWPRIGIWLAALLAVAVGIPLLDASSLPALWLLNGVGFAAVGLFDRLARHRQRLISSGWAEWRETEPIIDPAGPGGRTPPGRWLAAVPAVLTLAVSGVLAVLYAEQVRAVRAVEATSGPLPPEDLADPSWLAGLIGGTLLLGTLLTLVLARRGRDRFRLLREPQPAIRLRLGEAGNMVVVTTLDDFGFQAPLGLLRDLQPAIPGDLPEPRRVLVDQPEGAFDQPPVRNKRRVHRGPLTWVDDLWMGGEPMSRVQRGGTEVVVGGLVSDARPLAVMHEGRWLISTLPLRDPWTLRRWRHWVSRRPAPQPEIDGVAAD